MITIVDYDAGNIKSIVNMLRALGIPSRISGDPADIMRADKLILPGVGHFDYGMKELFRRGLVGALNQRVVTDGIPLLGICLGAQLLMRGSAEGVERGLGWIDGDTVAFDRSRLHQQLRVPHMGWAETRSQAENPLAPGLTADARFYFVHSFHMVCDRDENVLFKAQHGYEFVAGVRCANILGVQFHPEKSHRFGMQVLRNFGDWQPNAQNMTIAA
jgi:imidazole glycerol-phosphate synthase subunit HisH